MVTDQEQCSKTPEFARAYPEMPSSFRLAALLHHSVAALTACKMWTLRCNAWLDFTMRGVTRNRFVQVLKKARFSTKGQHG
jgi:hypothetical protein